MSNATIGWLLVIFAGALEVLWPIGMKYSEGFTKWRWVAVWVVAITTSFGLLTLAVGKRSGLPIGTAYAVWTGMGAAGAVVVGIFLFGESSHWLRLLFLTMIIAGIVGLKVTHKEIGEERPTPIQTSVEQDQNP